MVPGAYVAPGDAVAKLIMMDPIKVEVAVASKTARGFARGDRVSLYPLDSDESVTGSVRQKSAVADRKSQTHKVSLFPRNWRVAIGVPPGGPAQSTRNSTEYRGARD